MEYKPELIEIEMRFIRLLNKNADCPICGAAGPEPCLLYRDEDGFTALDTPHTERLVII